MSKIIAFANQKGGVGKTTTAVSFASGLYRKGFKTLMIDADPQENASDTYKAVLDDVITLFDVFEGCHVKEAIQTTDLGDILPGDIQLARADQLYGNTPRGPYILKEALEPIINEYDYIIIDTPPNLGIMTLNALAAANSLIIPVSTERYSLKGLALLAQTINDIRKYSNKGLIIDGILITSYDGRTILARTLAETLQDIAYMLNTNLFNTKIRRSVSMGESQNEQDSIFNYAPNSTTGLDYNNFITEYLNNEKAEVKNNG